VLKYLRSIPYIHAGGCGISALAIYKWLKKNNKLKRTKPVFIYVFSDDFKHNLKKFNNREDLEAPSHCVLLHDDAYIDADGDAYVGEDKHLIYLNNINQLIRAINNRETWNWDFDRDKYIPEIEKKLGIKLDLS